MSTTQKPGTEEISWDNLELQEVQPRSSSREEIIWDNLELQEVQPRSSSRLEIDWEQPEDRAAPRDPFGGIKVQSEQRPGTQNWETMEVAAPQKSPSAVPGGGYPERGRPRRQNRRESLADPDHPISVFLKIAAWVVAMVLVASLAYALVENRAAEKQPPLRGPQPSEAGPTQDVSAPAPLELGPVAPALPGAPTLSVADVTVAEGNSGEVSLEFKVTVPSALPAEARVDYATANATALAESDYRPAQGTLVFKPGETSKSVKVSLIPDTIAEPDETFSLTFSRAEGISAPPASATAKIINDDAGGGPVISISDVRVKEGGPAKFILTITPPMTGPGSIVYATADGSAVAPGDYGPGTGTIKLKGRESKAELSVYTTVDPAPEPDETFFVNLSSPVGMQ
ncbi:MAG: Calx-beta domain-containing protein, partial [Actinomycetota bacterium]